MERYIGKVFRTNNYGDLVITKWVSSNEVFVRFVNTGYETVTSMSSISKGMVRDRLIPSVCGVGIIGNGITRIEGVDVRDYTLWKNMLYRCYDEKYQDKFPTYKGCSVSEEFKYFPYFKEWCKNQIGFDQDGWFLDKDILIKGNKTYSENACCFVPHEINNLFVKSDAKRENLPIGVSFNETSNTYTAQHSFNGRSKHVGNYENPIKAFQAYKAAKESYIKVVADKWKNLIDQRVYEALINYKVEIVD